MIRKYCILLVFEMSVNIDNGYCLVVVMIVDMHFLHCYVLLQVGGFLLGRTLVGLMTMTLEMSMTMWYDLAIRLCMQVWFT